MAQCFLDFSPRNLGEDETQIDERASLCFQVGWNQPKPPTHQWSFLVPLIGGRYHIITQLAIYKWYISGILYTANWGIIWYLPPIKGTRNNHWTQDIARSRSHLYIKRFQRSHDVGRTQLEFLQVIPRFWWEKSCELSWTFFWKKKR